MTARSDELAGRFARITLVDAGKCDDGCGASGDRVRIGRVQVCRSCASLRLRAAVQLAFETTRAEAA